MALADPRILDRETASTLALDPETFERAAAELAAGLPTRDPRRAWLRRALEYPYITLPFSFVQTADGPAPVLSFDPADVAATDVLSRGRRRTLRDACGLAVDAPRFPLLAYGANASLEGLQRKLGRLSGEHRVLPLIVGALADCDVVYSAHFAAYGSLPATIQHVPGSAARIAVAWVTERQLTTLAQTELNYRFGCLEQIRFDPDDGPALEQVYAFSSRHGCFAPDGSPLALAAVGASGRRLAAIDQRAALERAASVLGLDGAQQLVARIVEDYAWAVGRRRELGLAAQPFEHPRWRDVALGGHVEPAG